MEPAIGVFSNSFVTCNIYPSTIKNPYSVYLPKIENNQIQEYIHINETLITKFLYDIFINNVYRGKDIQEEKKNEFIIWINSFKNVNKSNWYVIISRMYKKNILN